MKACHQAKQNVRLLKSKDFRDLNQPGSYEQPLRDLQIYLTTILGLLTNHSAYWKECYATIPGVSHIGEMQIYDKEVYRLINGLNIHKEPDKIHSRVL